jgi:hypothetical protein
MPKRTEEKPPERPPRAENVWESMGIIVNPERDDTELYEAPITRNITLSNFKGDADTNFQREGLLLYIMCVSQGELLSETARAINALLQGDANIRRGIGGETQAAVTTYSVKQRIEKKVTGEEKKPLLGKGQGGA